MNCNFQVERSYANGFISFDPWSQFIRFKPPVDSYHILNFRNATMILFGPPFSRLSPRFQRITRGKKYKYFSALFFVVKALIYT